MQAHPIQKVWQKTPPPPPPTVSDEENVCRRHWRSQKLWFVGPTKHRSTDFYMEKNKYKIEADCGGGQGPLGSPWLRQWQTDIHIGLYVHESISRHPTIVRQCHPGTVTYLYKKYRNFTNEYTAGQDRERTSLIISGSRKRLNSLLVWLAPCSSHKIRFMGEELKQVDNDKHLGNIIGTNIEKNKLLIISCVNFYTH